MDLCFNDNRLTVGNSMWELDHRIIATRMLGDCVFVLFDYMEYEPNYRAANNLEAFTLSGDHLWTVSEHPVSGGAAAYVNFADTEDLIVYHFAGFECRIDPDTGKLLESIFTK